MKTKLLTLILFVFFLFGLKTLQSQTVLSPGDVTIIQLQADTPDDFAFVTFVDIDANTGIYFTDCGADASGFSTTCNEGAKKYTVPAGGLSAGDIIKFSVGSNTNFSTYTDSRIVGSLSLAISGDQLLVFQDATSAAGGANAANNPTFIFAYNNASTAFTADKNDSNQTGLPAGLSDTDSPRTALGVGSGTGSQDEFDNTVYNGTYDFSDQTDQATALAMAKIAFTNPSNYTKVDDITEDTYPTNVAAMPSALILSPVLSIENSNKKLFSIYPNPVSNGKLFIKSSSSEIKEVKIYNVLGGKVLSAKVLSGEEINVSNLNPGMYILTIIENEKSFTKKIVIR